MKVNFSLLRVDANFKNRFNRTNILNSSAQPKPVLSYVGDTVQFGKAQKAQMPEQERRLQAIEVSNTERAACSNPILHPILDENFINSALKADDETWALVEKRLGTEGNYHIEGYAILDWANRNQLYKTKMGFLQDPRLEEAEKLRRVNENPDILESKDLAASLGIQKRNIALWIEDKKLKAVHIPIKGYIVSYIDLKDRQNEEFLEHIKGKLPTSFDSKAFMAETNMSEGVFHRLLANGELTPLCTEYIKFRSGYLFDLNDKDNIATIETCNATKQKRLEYRLNLYPPNYVRIAKLSKAGYGSVEDLREMVKGKRLSAKIEKLDKKSPDGKQIVRTYVDAEDIDNKRILNFLKSHNPNNISCTVLAKQMGVKVSTIEKWIENGDLQALECVYPADENKIILDVKTPKNLEFIEKAKEERKIESEEKHEKSKKDASFRTRIAWTQAKHTREIMESLTKEDHFASHLFSKKKNGDILTEHQENILKSFYQNVWEQPGTKEEWSKASQEASRITRQIEEQGIDSVDDPEVLSIYHTVLKDYPAKI